MKLTNRHNASKLIVRLLLPAVLSICTMHAAEVRLSDLPKKIGQGKLDNRDREDREYTVITKTGAIYRDRRLIFSPVNVELSSGPIIPLGELAKIRVKHHKEWLYAIGAPGLAMCGNGDILLTPLAIPLVPFLLVVTAATAPVTISVEAVKRLLPGKVIKVRP
jgi:hypothetical protein